MATKVTTQLIDDVDGGNADQTVPFALDGTSYEIDLSAKNAEKLRKALEPWVGNARRLSRNGTPVKRTKIGPDPAAVRAWAESQGKKVSTRGRVPETLVAEFQEATGG